MIQLDHINKTFRVARRGGGYRAALKSLFRREYIAVQALRDVSFTIGDGEMVGYIGPNGAGKSSTIKIMSGVLNPDSGSCVIDGLVPWKDRRAHVRNIGVVFGQRSQLWWDVPVIDSFELIRDIYRVDPAAYRRNLDDLNDLLELSDLLRTPARQLSLGQRMRCEFAASLLHDPKTLFLDEPTIGLDAVSKLAVRRFIRRINQEKNTTVILTTHDMQDIEALAQRILFIGKGRILLDGPLEQLRAQYDGVRTLTVRYTDGTFILPPGMTLEGQTEGQAVFRVDTAVLPVSAAIETLSKNADIQDLSVSGATAEQLVVSLYQRFAV